MGSCDTVLIGIESDELVFDPIVAGVGGVLGGLIGVLLGVFLTKFCCLKVIMKRCFGTGFRKEKKEVANLSQFVVDETTRKKTSPAFVMRKKTLSASTTGSEISNTKTSNKSQLQDNYGNSFVETALMASLENMLDHRFKFALESFNHIFMSSWKDRQVCILQIFKIILNDYTINNTITKSEQEKIMRDAETTLDNILCEDTSEASRANEKGNVANLNNGDKLDSMVSLYRNAIYNFERSLLELFGFRDAAAIHDVLIKCFKNIEKNVQQNQKLRTQILMESFYRDLLVLQAYNSGNTAMHELMRKRRHYYEVMLNRLVESDRLNENESDASWQQIKEEVETKFDDVIDELRISSENLKLSFHQQRKKTETSLRVTRNKSIERYVSDETSASPFQRIQNYFSLISALQQQEVRTMQEITKSEVFHINELQKKAKRNLQTAFEEMQERFCETLFTNEVLSEKEAQVFLNELTKKNKRVGDDVITINQIQTKIIDRETTLMRSFQTTDAEDDENITDALRQMLMSRDEVLAEKFIESQSYLPDDEREAIVDEYNVFKMLLDNHSDLTRCRTWFNLDVDLLKIQIKILLLERQEERLSSDEDVDHLVKRLEKQRKDYEVDNGEFYSRAGISSASPLNRAFLCELVADSTINILLPQMKKLKKKEENLNLIKDGFISRTSQLDVYDRQLQQLAPLHQDKVRELESILRQENDFEIQVLRERLNAENSRIVEKLRGKIDDRPLSASSLSASDLLQRLFDQEKSKREIETMESDVEATSMTQIYLHLVAFQDKLRSGLQDLDKAMFCKLAKAIGMRRNNFIQCITDALVDATESEKKKTIADVMQYWEKVNTFEPVYQPRRESRVQTRQKGGKKSKRLFSKISSS